MLSVTKENGVFRITAEDGGIHHAKKVMLATGFKEVLPAIESVKAFYGTSLFSCQFCGGWELRDRPLAVISEEHAAFHVAKMVSNWTDDLIVCTNGKQTLSTDEKGVLEKKE